MIKVIGLFTSTLFLLLCFKIGRISQEFYDINLNNLEEETK